MTRVLDVRGLHAGYDGVPTVRDLDLHVESGEVVALLGPNGAGKTTTLLTVSGLLAPIAGTIDVLGGGPPSTRRPQEVARRGLAHVPEHRALFAELTHAPEPAPRAPAPARRCAARARVLPGPGTPHGPHGRTALRW